MTDQLSEEPAAVTVPAPEKNAALREIRELAAAAEALDVLVEEARQRRKDIDRSIRDINEKKSTLLTDLKQDPLKLGKQIAELDHAVSVLEYRKGPADAELAAAQAEAESARNTCRARRKRAISWKIGVIYNDRKSRLQRLLSEFGIPWNSPAEHVSRQYVNVIDSLLWQSQLASFGPLGPLQFEKQYLEGPQGSALLDDDFDPTGVTPR